MIVYSICIQRCEPKPSAWCISPWLAWRHIYIPKEKERKKKLIYMIPNRPVLLFTFFLPLLQERERERRNFFFSSCVPRFSIFARAAWINMGMEHTASRYIYTHTRWFFCWRLSIDTTQFLRSRLLYSLCPKCSARSKSIFISYIAMKMSAFYEPQKYSSFFSLFSRLLSSWISAYLPTSLITSFPRHNTFPKILITIKSINLNTHTKRSSSIITPVKSGWTSS